MGVPKLFRRIFAVLLIVAWGGYALLNMGFRFPYLQRGYQDGWDYSSRLEGVLDAANSGVLFQDTFQDLNAYGEHYLDKQTSSDFLLVRGDNGKYMYSTFYTYETYDYAQQALQLREVQQAAQERGTSFVYMNCIDLYVSGIGSYGSFPVSDLNPRSDAFLYYLNGYGVDYLDTRAVLDESELSPYEYRYNTEPHWTIPASFEAYLGLVDKLQSQGVDIDPEGFYASRENFQQVEYSGQYIGELGKRMGIPFTEPEDFTLLTPDFETNFTLSYLPGNQHSSRSGDFSSVLLDSYWLENENPYERNFYNAYLTAEYDYRIIRNNQNPDGPKILIIGDSYMLPVAAFLATAASEIHLVWPYGLPDEQGLLDYLAENEFDSIIVGMSPSSLEGAGFNFLDGIEVPDIA